MTFKKINLLIVLTILSTRAFANPVLQSEKGSGVLDWAVQNVVLLMGVTVIVGATFGLFKAVKAIWLAQQITNLEAKGMTHAKAVKTASQGSFWGYIYQQLEGGVQLEGEGDIMLNHDYDGIRELDNNLPPWWVGMFYATMIFAGIYMVVYHVLDIGMSQEEQYKKEVQDAEIAIVKYNAAQAELKKSEKVLAEQNENEQPVSE